MADFQAELGNAANNRRAGPETRLAQLVPGVNPYVTGSALPPGSPVFVGRERQLAETLGVLRHPDKPGSVSVLGERRFGKSSFLNQVRDALRAEPGLVTIHATTQDWTASTPTRFFGGLQDAIRQALARAGHPQAAGDPPTPASAASSVEADSNGTARPQAQVGDYATLRDLIGPLAAGGLRFVLLLDELEGITGVDAFDADFFSNLRALGERPEYRFGHLIASRRPLKELCREHRIEASSFWNIFGLPQYVSLLDAADALALVREPLQRTLPAAPVPDWERLWQEEIEPLTGDHPCLMQLVLHEHWQALAAGYPPDPERIGVGLRDFLEDLWANRHGRQEWRVLIQAAAGKPADADHLARDLRLRGLLRADGSLFCAEMQRLIPGFIPGGLSLADAVKRFNEGGEAANKLLDHVERMARRAGRVWNAFRGNGADAGDSEEAGP